MIFFTLKIKRCFFAHSLQCNFLAGIYDFVTRPACGLGTAKTSSHLFRILLQQIVLLGPSATKTPSSVPLRLLAPAASDHLPFRQNKKPAHTMPPKNDMPYAGLYHSYERRKSTCHNQQSTHAQTSIKHTHGC